MKNEIRQQKQDVVREALYGAAIDLFARNGFDETTVEEVTREAGVSRRTFFRYFDSKDDLLAYSLVTYANVLAEAVQACPATDSPFQVMRRTVFAAVERLVAEETRTRQTISISERSASARQAYQSRMMDIEDTLAKAFASRFHKASPYDVRPRLLAAMTSTIVNASVVTWVWGKQKDLPAAAEDVLSSFRSILCSDTSTAPLPTGSKSKRHSLGPVKTTQLRKSVKQR
jgi:AcrR family transcriptional regulator